MATMSGPTTTDVKLLGLILGLLISGAIAGDATATDTPLATRKVAEGLSGPTFLVSPPGDYRRLFVGEQRLGLVRIIELGEVAPEPFLDISDRVSDVGGERGLLSLAFHPDYDTNGYLYVLYTEKSTGASTLDRYQVSPTDPDFVDPSTGVTLISLPQPTQNHNGGTVAFGPNDGYLYVSFGDGGPGSDPNNHAQDGSVFYGKILRLDVDGSLPYEIPPDNPFVGAGDPADEIWALGFRNPWRFTFDPETGDLWTTDVGQFTREEVNFQPAASTGGENYGWRCMEGTHCTGLTGCICNSDLLTDPIHEIHHTGDEHAIIGGCIYRGCLIPDLQGTYFFSDFGTAKLYSLRYDGVAVTDLEDRTAELAPPGSSIDGVFSFAQDSYGEMYILDGEDGEIYKIVPADGAPRSSNYGTGWPGTLGVPALTSVNPPVICDQLDLSLENSYDQTTTAILFIGLSAGQIPSQWGGDLLVLPFSSVTLGLAVGTNVFAGEVPCDPALCGTSLYLQALELDPSASAGISFTPGLELLFSGI